QQVDPRQDAALAAAVRAHQHRERSQLEARRLQASKILERDSVEHGGPSPGRMEHNLARAGKKSARPSGPSARIGPPAPSGPPLSSGPGRAAVAATAAGSGRRVTAPVRPPPTVRLARAAPRTRSAPASTCPLRHLRSPEAPA